MRVFLIVDDDSIEIRARMEGDGVVGDARRLLHRGETFFGWGFSELAIMGSGEHDLQPREVPAQPSGL